MIRNQKWSTSFKNALGGIFYALRTQRNFKVHIVLSFAVLALAFWLEISLAKFLFLVLAITFGLVVEMANTAFEKTLDAVSEEYNSKIKVAKDVSAGMMLLASVGLAILGILIFLPPLWEKITGK